jgi:Ca-activated chloride channel family protein
MEKQDKLFEEMKRTAHRAEEKDFPSMEKVWARVEEKLDKKDDRKTIALWKKIAVAASLLLLVSLGYQFLTSDRKATPVQAPQVVTAPPKAIPVRQSASPAVLDVTPDAGGNTQQPVPEKQPPIVPYAGEILKRQINEQAGIAIQESTDDDAVKKNVADNAEPVTNAAASNIASANATFHAEPVKATTASDKFIVSGVVSDHAGRLPGASVSVKGTTRAVQTDIDGRYAIEVKKGEELAFDFIGLKSATAKIGHKKTVNMTLENDAIALESVVIDGYKSRIKKKSAIAQSTVAAAPGQGEGFQKGVYTEEAKAIADKRPNAPLVQSLQGKVAGVNIATPSGAPGSGRIDVVMRGYSSTLGSTVPLYVVDNVVVSEQAFRQLSTESVDKITVIKDSSATAIYGSRGANGVVMVTTKDGAEKQLKKARREQRKAARKAKKLQPQATVEPQTTARQIQVSKEDYESFIENPFETPALAPLSTFSIDVDNASYTNVRRFINYGQTVPKDAVRVEEMVNFFKYDYPQPSGPHPFSISTEYADCPWNAKHKLLKIGLQGKEINSRQLPASNLVFLVDVSGSMAESNKLPLLKESMKVLVDQLRANDKVSIVVYAGAAGLVLPPTPGNDKKAITTALDNLQAGGSTAGGAGIELAYKIAVENFIKGGNNRVILATDGDFNVGASSDTDMETLIEEKRKTGVFLTCLGFGMGNYKDSKMETLSDKGNGNYAYIDNFQEANRFLGREFKGSMFAIAKDVKIQIEFNPELVKSYRLIGYENRKLRPEDFVNDAIDAGELGSGHTVTAFYEIIPIGTESEYFTKTDDLKYTELKSTGYGNELATVKFRYKKPDGDASIEMAQTIANQPATLPETSDDFKFGAAVAWFGLKLRDSKLVPDKSSVDILELAKQGISKDQNGYKAEFLRLVEAVK